MTLIFILMKLTCTFSVVKDVKLSIRYRKGKTKCILQWDSNSQPECCKWTLEHLAKMTKWLISTDKYSQHSSIIWSVWLNCWMFVYELSGCGFQSRCCHLTSDMASALSKEFLDIHPTIECGFTLKRVRDMIITCRLRCKTSSINVL